MARKPTLTDEDRILNKKYPVSLTLTSRQLMELTNLGNGNFSKGVRTFIASLKPLDGPLLLPTEKPMYTKGVTLPREDLAKLKDIGHGVSGSFQVAWANHKPDWI